ncbi:sugar ABC transporter substrate-binding protein [Luedemannella flava]|uniref:Sugar ABC transporter substrate-binding protein n=1 Tax=Luedemannella flava TaxID=349316 RepID=A0ABP4YUJ1_9ACTN
MQFNAKRGLVAVGALALLLTGAACGNDDGGSTGGGNGASVDKGFKVGLLLPETKTTRYETFDKPLIEAKIKELCPKCEVVYQNADQNHDKQLSQAESLITQGVKVMILDPVDAKAAGGIVTKAKDANIPVISYDRLTQGPISYYVSYVNKQVGITQGQALLDALSKDGDPKRGQIVMINGSPTDPNAADFKAGAHSVLDGKVNIGAEYDTPDWSNDKAQQEMEQAITKLGKDKIIGVYAANDGTAGGAIAAMKSAGFAKIPFVTGQDAELAAIQRILTGDQGMTVYKAIKPEANAAAEMAIAAATGQTYSAASTTTNNGSVDVPSVLLPPVAVTKDNIKDTVVADGFYKVDQICTAEYAEACKAAGLL